MLRSHVEPQGAFDVLAPQESPSGPLISLELTRRELDDFMELFEQTATNAQNVSAMDRLGHALARVESGFEDDVDPGAHLLRPAGARLGYSWKEGQYLAFIFNYHRLHRRSPAETDFRAYFSCTAPTVHEMLKTLQRRGFIARMPRTARSIRLLLDAHEIPELESP